MADLLFCDVRGRRRERRFRAGSQFEIGGFTDDELRARYRFGRESILFITNLVARDISRNTRRNHALHPLRQVLIALRFYASGSFLQVIGDTFGIDKSTVSRVINDVTRALISKQPHFIKWPSTNDECATIKNALYLRGGFPCVIGCVDGTHIRLQTPSQHENNYVNRKGFHSINVQVVCNHEGESSFCFVERLINEKLLKRTFVQPPRRPN